VTAHDLIKRLEDAKIHFTLTTVREAAVMFIITVPGERWEVEVYSDGHLDIEVFKSTGGVVGEEKLPELFERFSD
jgi:hypothetical protein